MRVRLVATFFALVASACGGGAAHDHAGGEGSDATPDRTVRITMRDIAFAPDRVTVRAGETVAFVFRNAGSVDHDAFIGSADEQAKHEREMNAGGGHAMHDSDAVVVAPGKTARLTRTFKQGDRLIIGCHEPGHYEAGMRTVITVT